MITLTYADGDRVRIAGSEAEQRMLDQLPGAHWNGSEHVMDLSAIEREVMVAELGEFGWADLQERWRQMYSDVPAHRTRVACAYCRSDPGHGERCRTCGAPNG